MYKCDFNKTALQHGCSPINYLHFFRTTKETSGELRLTSDSSVFDKIGALKCLTKIEKISSLYCTWSLFSQNYESMSQLLLFLVLFVDRCSQQVEKALQNSCSWKCHKVHRKRRVPGSRISFFNKVASFHPASLLKRRLQNGCCSCKLRKMFRKIFFAEHLQPAASVSK